MHLHSAPSTYVKHEVLIFSTKTYFLPPHPRIRPRVPLSKLRLMLVHSPAFHFDYSCDENTMRGAAKSLATPPAAFTVNITGVSAMEDASIFQFNSRHQGDFSISS